MNTPNRITTLPVQTETPANPNTDLEAATLPSSLVRQVQEALTHCTLIHSGILRERMQALQIQPRPLSQEDPGVSVYSTDVKSHASPDCLINTMMMSAAHAAALDLHNLACTVEPVTPLLDASERFGVAFFAQIRTNAGAAIRLRDTLDIIAGEIAARSLSFVPERPWIELVHQMVNPFTSAADSSTLLPVELFRIRYRGLTWQQVETLLADALRSLPLLTEQKGRRDVFTLTLSGHA
jgi:hypothetical protein